MIRRTIVVGDVHGCLAELEALLDALRPGRGDALWFIGDLVDRGPDPAGVVRRVRALGAGLVRGNHEDKHVRYRGHLERHRADPRYRVPMAPDDDFLRTHAALDAGALDFLAAAPELVRLSADWVLVHAGLLPGRSLDRPLRPMNLRYLHRRTGRMVTLDEQAANPGEAVHWSERWQGPWRVIYGHHARPEIDERALSFGIDTGCVYGGHLTAAVLEGLGPGDRPTFVQVAAERAWHDHPLWSGED